MKKIKLKYKDYFERQKPLYQFLSCEYSFANLAIWGDIYDIQWKDINGIPLIYIARDKALLFPQIPDLKPDDLVAFSKEFTDNGVDGTISQVPEEYVLEHPALKKHFIITEDPDFSDYIHSTERLCLLQGKKLRKKRNLITQFAINNPEYSEHIISDELFSDCLNLVENSLDPGKTSGKNEELNAIKKAFSLFKELSLDGNVIVMKDRIIAFSVFSRHIDGSYTVHFEKTDSGFKGASQIINQKTAEYLSDKCDFINREQDLGIPGLRKAKKSYDPDTILINYELRPK